MADTLDIDQPQTEQQIVPYIKGIYTNLQHAYGKDNLPDEKTFTEKMMKDNTYRSGVRDNLVHVYGKDNVPELSDFESKLGVEKKNQVGTPVLPDGTSNTSQSNSSLLSGNALSNNSVFKTIGQDIPVALQDRHDAILNRMAELNKPVTKNASPFDNYNRIFNQVADYNQDLVQSINPKKVGEINQRQVEMEHNANGHWGNIVSNVLDNIDNTGTKILSGTLSAVRSLANNILDQGDLYDKEGNPIQQNKDKSWLDDPLGKLVLGLNGHQKKVEAALNGESQLPNTFLGDTVSSLTAIAPDIAGAALTPELKIGQGVSLLSKAATTLFNPFTNYLIGKGVVTGYGTAKEQGQSAGQATVQALKGGAEGAKQGIELALLGAGSGLATKGIMAQAEKAGLTGAKGVATRQLVNLGTDLVAYGLVQPTANAAEEGRFPTMKEIANGAGIAAAFRIKGGAEELRNNSKLNKAIEETQNQRQGVAISNFVDADHDAIKQVYDQPETAQELNIKALEAAKKAKETTDLSKKQEYVAQAITLTKASNVKSVADMVLNNPQGLEDFKNSPDIPDQVKQQFLQKAQEVTDLLKPKKEVSRATVSTENNGKANETDAQTKEVGTSKEGAGNTVPSTTFKTSKGSDYTVQGDGTTIRDKAARLEHPDSGIQDKSDKTYYITKEDMDKLSEIQTTTNDRKTIAETPDGKIGVKYLTGKDAGKFEERTLVTPTSEPKVGLHPLELWDKDNAHHFGNEITEVKNETTQDTIKAEAEKQQSEKLSENIQPSKTAENELPTNTTEGQEAIPTKENEVGSSNTSGNNEPTIENNVSTNENESSGNTGIKNKVSNETRTRLTLPKVEVPKLGKDVTVLHEGKKIVEDGTVNPQEVVNRITSTDNHNMSRDEAKAMQYYMHQLGRAQDLVNEQLSQDLEPQEKLGLISQQQQLSDLQDAATEANIKAGKDWSDVGNIRQILVDKSFNPSRERAIIKEAYGGDVPKEVKEKLDATIKERDEAIAARTKLEEKLRDTEAKLKIAEMKKGAAKGERKDHKANRAALIDELKAAKEEHEKWLEDNGIQKQGISGFSLTPKMAKIIGKIAADYVHEGYEKLEEIVNRVYEEVKAILPGIDKKDIRDAIAIVDAEKLNEKGEKLEKKIADNDIASNKPKLKQKFERNNDWVKANQRVINAEYKIRKLKNEAFNSQKNMYQKGLMWASKLIRASVLSGTNVLYKLASAATIGGAGKRIPEQAFGAIWSQAFKGIAQKAPIEGYLNAKSEAKFYTEFFNPKKFAKNSFEILKTGASELTKKNDGRINDDLAEITMPGKQTTTASKIGKGTLKAIDKTLSFPTDLHMIIKDPVKRATYEASLKNAMVWAEKSGLDINDPLVINSMENAAYKRANYEIFQEENALSKKFNSWKSKMDKGGNVEATGKLLADFMIPVSTVPTNIVKRILSTSPLGLIRGGYKVTEAYRKGIENLSSEEADAIMRQLKQGTLGTALALVGWFGASHFGGLYSKYDPNKKRQEGELTSDQMEVNGQMIPKPVQHALPLEIIQAWATTRHIYDNYRDNKGASNLESLLNAGLGSAGALAEQIPIVSTAGLAIEAGNDPYKGEKLKEDMQRRVQPQILRETGVIGTKSNPRQTFIDRNTKDGGLFRNDLKIYNSQGQQRIANLQEFNEFKDKRKELLEKRMNQLYDGTDDENIFKSGKKKVDDMSASELTSAITTIKTQVNKEAKTELFGKQRMSHQERIEDKKLLRQKKMN